MVIGEAKLSGLDNKASISRLLLCEIGLNLSQYFHMFFGTPPKGPMLVSELHASPGR
jgi:hypothetical protein